MNESASFFGQLLNRVSPELILFFGQVLIVVLAMLGCIAAAVAIFSAIGLRGRAVGRLEAKSINDEWVERKRSLESLFLSKKEWKSRLKDDAAAEKARIEAGNEKNRLWVLDFAGDMQASRTDSLRHEITAILEIVDKTKPERDEVLLRLESPGGTVTGYGLAAAQLARLRQAGVKLTVSIDEVAASGGYMMAAVGSRIIASPFAVIGSIGVIGALPNLNRLLKRFDVEYLEITAGEHKRPVSMFGPLSDDGIEKFRSQIADTHVLFRQHVAHHRPQLDIAKVATGDIWHGADGLPLGLVDAIETSDEYLTRARLVENRDVFSLRWKPARSLRERIEESAAQLLSRAFDRALSRLAARNHSGTT